MTSQVSFKFDGEHNKQPIVDILRKRLKKMKHTIEKEGNVYRIYVAANETEDKVLNVCMGIQSNAVYDKNREI